MISVDAVSQRLMRVYGLGVPMVKDHRMMVSLYIGVCSRILTTAKTINH
jgi:hypothetical protein